MRRILVIGIGTGNPEHLTVEAVRALNTVDVVFVLDKGGDKDALVRLRREICARYITGRPYRIVEASDPERDRNPADYGATVEAWHAARAALYETMFARELGEDQCGAILVWGDPSLYDSTIRIIDRIVARGRIAFGFRVIPGITSVQALCAGHRIPLNRIGAPVRITTGRRLSRGLPRDDESVAVMLDGNPALSALDPDLEIHWGAYLGSPDEILVSGRLGEVADTIARVRAEARARHGWIMDTYLLRRPDSES
ncbi:MULTISPECIES: precorrin-6A synthase (deacetylating) [unclassified Methylobacterium]|uniref:precorrin-6A synthase (deacetylating) n=1 Tax=unclassified Methylobacterium TaxID=2615210 RepID=UPI0006FAFBFC|nr:MULTISPECIES: precorrin-6A synthase (deacetylating) [unclassified Methylobacterium]KQP51481.1 precorrin 6A synthase [Methylobacterium sp. Leaf108]KQT77411.1 precorrin 6A synthase [Methylobacterium sp. Leaf466]